MKVGRLAEISRVFLEEGLALALEQDGHARIPHLPKSEREKAERLCRALLRLGPTFVKFGQLLSSRVDLFAPEFLEELGKLRAHVPPFPSAEARRILEAELGQSLDVVFAEFPEEPVASASMAQVYRTRLQQTGAEVAVKVARPHLRETLDRDLELIVAISKGLDQLLPVYHKSMVHSVALEYATRTRQESDLLAEAHAMMRFRDVTESVREFVVPRVYREYCTPQVLVMQWLDGTLLDDVKDAAELRGLDVEPQGLALSLLRLQLVMSYEYGLVHGDTHAGNLILRGATQVGLIDFGLNGQVPRKLCDQMLELLFYQASGKTSEAARAFEQIFEKSAEIDSDKFRAELTALLADDPVAAGKSPLTSQLADGLRLGAKYQLRAQSELFLVLRNLTIVEGLVLTYCPGFDVVGHASTILRDVMTRRALSSLNEPALREFGPLLLLNLAKRPDLVQGLLRMERAFADSRDLGEFLKKEGVFDYAPPRPKRSVGLPLVLGALGALIATLLWKLWE